MKTRPLIKHGKECWEACLAASESSDGKRKRFFGATRAKAVARAERYCRMTGNAAAFPDLSPAAYAVAARWSAPGRLTPEEIDQACREFDERRATGVTAADAVTAYLDAPRETPLSDAHLKPLKTRLAAFALEFGERRMADITAGELEDFYRAQGRSSPNYFSACRALFRFAHQREWILTNPFDRLTKPALTREEDDLLTPEQMAALLDVSGVALTRLLILGGFCGLRHSEAMRLDLADIDRQTWEIHVRSMKTSKRGIRERWAQTTAQAQAWLQAQDLPKEGPAVPMADANLRKHRTAACEAIGLPSWPDNSLRRSFASYHVAAFEDAAKTAEILGHTDASTTKGKYLVARQKAVAMAWFAIMPKEAA